jgi:hypothetical protein
MEITQLKGWVLRVTAIVCSNKLAISIDLQEKTATGAVLGGVNYFF